MNYAKTCKHKFQPTEVWDDGRNRVYRYIEQCHYCLTENQKNISYSSIRRVETYKMREAATKYNIRSWTNQSGTKSYEISKSFDEILYNKLLVEEAIEYENKNKEDETFWGWIP